MCTVEKFKKMFSDILPDNDPETECGVEKELESKTWKKKQRLIAEFSI